TLYYVALKVFDMDGNASAISNVAHIQFAQRIMLDPGMVTYGSVGMGEDNAYRLVDEQDSDEPSTFWHPGQPADITYPVYAYLDLGIEKRYTIKHISLYDGVYNGNFIIEYGEPGHWQPLLASPLNKNGEWAEYP